MTQHVETSSQFNFHQVYDSQVTTIRDTTKWLTGALAGVGAVILATVKFTEIGELSGDYRWFAIFCAIGGLSCVFWAIYVGCRVLSSPRPTIDEVLKDGALKGEVENGSVLLLREYIRHGEPSLDELHECYQRSRESLRAQEEVCRLAHAPSLGLLKSTEEARSQTEQCRAAEQEILSYANYLRTRDRFNRAQAKIAALALAVLGFCITFTVTAADGRKSVVEANRITEPVKVAVTITKLEERQAFEKTYKCRLPDGQFEAWAVGGDYRKPMLVLSGSAGLETNAPCGPFLHQFGDGGSIIFPAHVGGQ